MRDRMFGRCDRRKYDGCAPSTTISTTWWPDRILASTTERLSMEAAGRAGARTRARKVRAARNPGARGILQTRYDAIIRLSFADSECRQPTGLAAPAHQPSALERSSAG